MVFRVGKGQGVRLHVRCLDKAGHSRSNLKNQHISPCFDSSSGRHPDLCLHDKISSVNGRLAVYQCQFLEQYD
jgi:hypothetical protein